MLDYIDGPESVWEQDPLNRIASDGMLSAYKHEGFWHPMDTLRDRIVLDDVFAEKFVSNIVDQAQNCSTLTCTGRSSTDECTLVERFEFFIGGMELGNAYSEINDAEDQASRFELQLAERQAGSEEALEDDPDYVEALTYGMPPTAGLGLGIDRLAIVLTGRDSIRDVILFPALKERL